jgi:hypothetical protein
MLVANHRASPDSASAEPPPHRSTEPDPGKQQEEPEANGDQPIRRVIGRHVREGQHASEPEPGDQELSAASAKPSDTSGLRFWIRHRSATVAAPCGRSSRSPAVSIIVPYLIVAVVGGVAMFGGWASS